MLNNFVNLENKLKGNLLKDKFSRGLYATDASIYQINPHAVVIPKNKNDIFETIKFAKSEGFSILSRGGGTSQCGQTVNRSIVIDNSKFLNKIKTIDVANKSCVVEPGIVLDQLNIELKKYGLFFPVDVSTSSRATIGGMAGNNSCGGRSIKYGIMRDNVLSISAIMSDGSESEFSNLCKNQITYGKLSEIINDLINIGEKNKKLIHNKLPNLLRRVGGYNLDALIPDALALRPNGKIGEGINLSHLIVGSEGTLNFSTEIELKLSELPKNRILGICHFPSFFSAMDAAQHIVKLNPSSVELIDDTMLRLAKSISIFKKTLNESIVGSPKAVLVVEFSENYQTENEKKLKHLCELINDLGFSWKNNSKFFGGVVEARETLQQDRITEMRKSGLNIMMSMKSSGKPVSFIEDCSVSLENLANYTSDLKEIFKKYSVDGTWYAHASVGCLHVRPVLDIRRKEDVIKMRNIAEETFKLVKKYDGSHSGEHGDGIVRSEFHEKMYGKKITNLFKKIKSLFDENNLFNPGKIVDAPKMDARELFRYAPSYKVKNFETTFDWSSWTGNSNGFQGAIEMCNNNGSCRKLKGGVMCPSFRVTRDEKDSTRGRANALRLAISGQLGEGALVSNEMQKILNLCVSCKACKRECPTGVDMAKLKAEVMFKSVKLKGLNFNEKLIAYLPYYAKYFTYFPKLSNFLSNYFRKSIFFSKLYEHLTGFSSKKSLPKWRTDFFRNEELPSTPDNLKKPLILFVDTFSKYFEPENLRSAKNILEKSGYDLFMPFSQNKEKLCCGRTFISVGLLDTAKKEAENLINTMYKYTSKGIKIVGLEPSCILSFRDEIPSLLKNEKAHCVSKNTLTFEEFLVREKPKLKFVKSNKKIYVHGHCHQKAFNVVDPIYEILDKYLKIRFEKIETSCCGMAGAFGLKKDTVNISEKMANLSLYPKIRKIKSDDIILADGTSCRSQIFEGTNKTALHLSVILDKFLIK